MRCICLLVLCLSLSIGAAAQQTLGLFTNQSESFNGYTLFAPIGSTETFLIDNCGEYVHSWSSAYRPGLSCYLLENGLLLRAGRITGPDGGSGIVELIDWEGNVVWEYSAIDAYGRQHHDVEILPNGNILLIVWDEYSQAELAEVGSETNNEIIRSEQIIEVEPNLATGAATVVWQWRAWDHLIQDLDSSLDNFGVVADHPERIHINFLNHNNPDWLHFNGVDYNADLDQIMISVHRFSELWVIDHSTSTAEASGSTGGDYNQGGDLLYRWGNPQAYGQGTADDQKFFRQHHTHWIPEGFVDAGKIMAFNNRAGTPFGQDYSTVDVIAQPADAFGNYAYSGGAYAPVAFDWRYQAATPTDFYSDVISGAERLPNGNTLICQGVGGRFFEVNQAGDIVWEYINPVNNSGALAQGEVPFDNNVFRCTRYAPTYAGLAGQDLIPQGYIESDSSFDCQLTAVGLSEFDASHFTLSPNPAHTHFFISLSQTPRGAADVSVEVHDMLGRVVEHIDVAHGLEEIRLDVSGWKPGAYIVQVTVDGQSWSAPLLKR